MNPHYVRHHDLDNAEELLDVLQRGRVAQGRRWLFRGHADATWALLPAALRDDARLSKGTKGPLLWHSDQVEAEFRMLATVLKYCDEQGIAFPDDHYLDRRKSPHDQERDWAQWCDGIKLWPPDEYLSQLALLQHYGAPTRMLDWTWKPLVGAYFAARDGAELLRLGNAAAGQRIAVWCLHRWVGHGDYSDDRQAGRRVEIVAGPAGQIPNMAAQTGCFTLIRALPTAKDETIVLSVDDLIEESGPFLIPPYGEVRAEDYDPPWLLCYTLPIDAAPRLLATLHDQFISAAVLFPGYGGAVQAWKDLSLWR